MEDLSRDELFTLKEIALTGQIGQRTHLVHKFLEKEIIIDAEGGFLELTPKGRRLLVRGSPLLWDVAA